MAWQYTFVLYFSHHYIKCCKMTPKREHATLTGAGWTPLVSWSSRQSPGSWTDLWRHCHQQVWWWRQSGPGGKQGRRSLGTQWEWCSRAQNWCSAGCRPLLPETGLLLDWCTSRTSWRIFAWPPVLCLWPKSTHNEGWPQHIMRLTKNNYSKELNLWSSPKLCVRPVW